MQFILISLLLFINPVKDLNKVAETNALKKEAKEAYAAGDFDKAIENYEKLTQELGITDENIMLNLGNAYYKKGASEQAASLYQNLIQSENNSIRSAANNQMGILSNQQQKKEEAINYFKEALKANPSNEAARFNYSKLKKEQEENQQNQDSKDDKNKDNKDQQQNQQNKDQNQQDQEQQDQEQKENQENQDQQDQSGNPEEEQNEQEQQDQGEEQQENQKSTAEKLEEMNMTEEKAKMILEAMKNNEVQYIQQNKKKPQSRVDDGKPDW